MMLLCTKAPQTQCFCVAGPLQASGPAEIRCAAPADSPEELPAPALPAGAAGAAARGAAGPHLHHQRKYPCWGSLGSSSSNPAGGRQAAWQQEAAVSDSKGREESTHGGMKWSSRKEKLGSYGSRKSCCSCFSQCCPTWIYTAVVKGSVR